MSLYDRWLATRIRWSDASTPDHVALVITERDLLEQGAYDTLEALFRWSFEYGADRLTVYVSVLDDAAVPSLVRAFDDVEAPHELAVRGPTDGRRAEAPIRVSIGQGGKEEFATAVRSFAESVAAGEMAPEDLDGAALEERLVFAEEPDLVVKTGAERLSDFMIWQSVYSELYFTDVNWRNFRKRDYLRAVRAYQTRTRRFGR